jgi:hypothetical protein
LRKGLAEFIRRQRETEGFFGEASLPFPSILSLEVMQSKQGSLVLTVDVEMTVDVVLLEIDVLEGVGMLGDELFQIEAHAGGVVNRDLAIIDHHIGAVLSMITAS